MNRFCGLRVRIQLDEAAADISSIKDCERKGGADVNISNLARAFMGEAHLNVKDSKALELRIGQLVRGVVLQVLDGNEALVSINGTQVRATLETPLPTGQSLWLQVSEHAADGKLILKPAVNGQLSSEQWISNMLRQLGLKDTALHREMIRLAGDMQISLQAKDAKALSTFLTRQGSQPNVQTIQSALLIVQRGLPLTAQSVDAVGQALHGRPVPQLLQSLLSQLASHASGADPSTSGSGQPEASTRQLAQQLTAAVRTWLGTAGTAVSLARGERAASTTATMNSSGQPAGELMNYAATRESSEGLGRATGAQTSASEANAAARHASSATSATSAASAASTAQGQSHAGSSAAQQQGAAASNQPNGYATGATADSPRAAQPLGNTIAAQELLTLRGSEQSSSPSASSSSTAQGAQATQGAQTNTFNGTMLRQLLHMLGMNHEHDLLERLILSQPAARSGASPQAAAGFMPQVASHADGSAGGLQGSQAQHVAADTVKSLLLQAANHEQLPLAVRETAQQIAQAITGQQLLLAADRAAPMSYVTLFVPFLNEQGEQMAGVHIQTRKDKRGNLDSDNCHLFFDLHMNTLGDMMIDVQIADRIVSLKIHNDHPMMQKLVEEGRQGLIEALDAMGYRLSTIKSAPLPAPSALAETAEQPAAETAFVKHAAQGMSYKGVDLRV